MMKLKKVKVEWHDAYTRDGWESIEECIEICSDFIVCHTVGYLLKKTKDFVIICHTYNESCAMGKLHIPMVCVKSITEI